MNTAIRLYADAANARTKQENGFDLTGYDERALAFASEYTRRLLAVDVNLQVDDMLDAGWELFGNHFSKNETGIKEELVKKYWKNGNGDTKLHEREIGSEEETDTAVSQVKSG
jgi:V/A-type H+-transporting ATPase subunit B